MPLGTIQGTSGNHRIAVTFHFGAPSPEEEHSSKILKMRQELEELVKKIRETRPFQKAALVSGLKHDVPKHLPAADQPDITVSLVKGKLMESARLLRAEKTTEVIRLCREILSLEPQNPTAWSRLGTAYYLGNNLARAVWAWDKAVRYEKNADEKRILYRSILWAKQKIGVPVTSAGQQPERTKPAERSQPNPQEVERLYQTGVEKYVRGDYEEAARIFERIMDMDPDNTPAKKAVDRIHRERKAR